MRNLKKALVLLLSLAMMLSIMVMGAGAAFPDQDQIDPAHADAVNMCVALKIIEGNSDGTFNPKGNVTREQMAKMICVLDNGGKVPQGATGTTFSDVPVDRWSNPFIETCAARGVVVGVGDGKFNPAGDVTGTQAAKMLLVELGYNDAQQKYVGPSWATYVNIDASAKGYYEDLEDIDVNAPLSREHAAQMIWNALQANEVEYSYTLVTNPDGSVSSMVTVGDKKDDVFGSKITLLKDKYGASEPVFLMTNISYNSDKKEYTYSGKVEGANEFVSFTSSDDYSDLFGQVVKAVVDQDDNVYGIVPEDSSVIVSAVCGDYDFNDDYTKVTINDVEYKIDSQANIRGYFPFCNVARTTEYIVGPEIGPMGDGSQGGVISYIPRVPMQNWFNSKSIDNNDNNKIDTLVFFPVYMGEVKFVNRSEVRVDVYSPYTGESLGVKAFEFDDEDVVLPTDLEKDDWVVVTMPENNKNEQTVIEKADVVSGNVGAVKNDGFKARIDGEWYEAAYNDKDALKVALDQDVDLVVYNGYYFNVDKQSADLDMAVITDTGSYNYKEKTIELTLMFTDGSEETVPVDEVTLLGGPTKTANDLNYALNNYEGFYDDLMGTTVFYSVSKGTYTLRYLTDSNNAFATITDMDNNDTDYTGGNFRGTEAVVYDKDDATVTIGNKAYDINDSAMVLIDKRDDGEQDGFTYMTGADFLKKNDQSFDQGVAVKDDDGNIAALIVTTTKNMTTGDEVYALITAESVEMNDDGDKALFIDMITKDGEEKHVETDQDALYNWVGEIITYTYDENGILIMPDDYEDSYAGSVKDFTDTRVIFHVWNDAENAWDTQRVSLADDPTIVAVGLPDDWDDFEDTTYEGNSLCKAASEYTEYYDGEYFLDNALYVLDDGDIIAIFCDVNGDIEFYGSN